jgi:hypothetical protein
MKKLLLVLSFIAGGFGVMAQTSNQCGFIKPPTSLISNFASVYEAHSYIDDMTSKLNWQENFQVREQNGINNAYATIIRNQRFIVYDNHFLEQLDSYAGTQWASISVLAHEMGHHYYNHMLNAGGSTPSKELEADYFSGYIMAKMGATMQEAEAAMSKIASPVASSTHPGKTDRLNAITKGWNAGNGGSVQTTPSYPVPGQTTSRIPTQNRTQQREPTNSNREPVNTNNDASWIHLSLYGSNGMTVYLSDDGRNFSTAAIKTNEAFVFKYDVYEYGWLRFGNNGKIYKLFHGRDYAIAWSRRLNNWTVVEI